MKHKKIIVSVASVFLTFLVYKLFISSKTVPVSFALGIISPDGVISPDGQQTVATSYNDKTWNHVTVFSLSGNVSLSRFDDDLLMYPSWSSDSKTLFFSRMDKTYDKLGHYDDNDDICSMPVEGKAELTSVVRKTGFNLSHPIASSDGVHLAYEQSPVNWRAAKNSTVWIRNLKTQQEFQVGSYRLSSLSHPTWSGDGNIIAFNGTQDPSQERRPPYQGDDKNPAIRSGLVWATSKEDFVPHFFSAKFSFFKPNSDGSQFAVITGEDAQGNQHLLQILDSNGNEIAKIKRKSVSVNVAWNSTNTAIFFLDNYYSNTKVQLCRWDIKTGKVGVLQPLNNLRGLILGYRNGILFYSTTGLKDEKNRQIVQLKTE